MSGIVTIGSRRVSRPAEPGSGSNLSAESSLDLVSAARRLHRHLIASHWNGKVLRGPDYGIRFNARIGRFVKSWLRAFPLSDHYVYAQAQKYWILDNWWMADLGLADSGTCGEIAVSCSQALLSLQRPEGYWEYPNPEWENRIATVEGNHAALGLLETFLRTGREPLLDGAKAWARFLLKEVGFQVLGNASAVNYFANRPGPMVPNNSTSALRMFALLATATGDNGYLEPCVGMVKFLHEVQLDSGELPYALDPSSSAGDRPHFLCFQYNAFQLLDLSAYERLTGDPEIRPVLDGLAVFLARGLTPSGAARYNCSHDRPEVPYYTAAVAAALTEAEAVGLGQYRSLANRAYARVLALQRPSGGMAFFSRGNYGILTDQRSYPRSESMILHHLLLALRLAGEESNR